MGRCSRLTCMCDDRFKEDGQCIYWDTSAPETPMVKDAGDRQFLVDSPKGIYEEAMDRVFGPDDMKPSHRPPLGENMVVLPKHYSRFQIEPARYSVENHLDGLEFNIIKYVSRAPYKHNDKGKLDYSKAIRSIVMKAKFALGDPDWWKPYKTDIEALLEQELSYGN